MALLLLPVFSELDGFDEESLDADADESPDEEDDSDEEEDEDEADLDEPDRLSVL